MGTGGTTQKVAKGARRALSCLVYDTYLFVSNCNDGILASVRTPPGPKPCVARPLQEGTRHFLDWETTVVASHSVADAPRTLLGAMVERPRPTRSGQIVGLFVLAAVIGSVVVLARAPVWLWTTTRRLFRAAEPIPR